MNCVTAILLRCSQRKNEERRPARGRDPPGARRAAAPGDRGVPPRVAADLRALPLAGDLALARPRLWPQRRSSLCRARTTRFLSSYPASLFINGFKSIEVEQHLKTPLSTSHVRFFTAENTLFESICRWILLTVAIPTKTM